MSNGTTHIPSAGPLRRGYKGGRKSSSVDSRPPTDAYRAGWERTFGQQQPQTHQDKQHG